MDRSVYPAKEFVEASKKFVLVYCAVRGTHGMKKVGGEETCSLLPGMTCLEHEEFFRELRDKLFPSGVKPQHVVLDQDGKEIGRPPGSAPVKLFIEKLTEAAKSAPPGLGSDDYLYMLDCLDVGGKAVAAGKTADAVKAFAAAVKLAKKPGATTLADRAQAELDKLSAEGKAAIDAALALAAAKDWAGAREGLKKVAAGYKGLPVEKEAAKALADVVKQENAAGKK